MKFKVIFERKMSNKTMELLLDGNSWFINIINGHEENWIFLENKIRFVTTLDLIKQIK